MKKLKIKSCPFCGTKPIVSHYDFTNTSENGGYQVMCNNEGCTANPMTHGHEKEDDAIKAWNVREV